MSIDENYRKLKKNLKRINNVPWGCLWFVIVVFPDHTHLIFFILKKLLINKLNNLHIKQNYYRTFSGLKFGSKFRK